MFLDRDGVINRQVIGGYVTKTDEFEFLPGVLDALGSLSGKFDYIFIVTNQQGIGKGIFSENDLADIHRQMCNAIHVHVKMVSGNGSRPSATPLFRVRAACKATPD